MIFGRIMRNAEATEPTGGAIDEGSVSIPEEGSAEFLELASEFDETSERSKPY
jgi:D-alanyl-D-alanine dipeptidase